MYAPFFGLRQEPFSIAPDPRYLYMSERHREALAHLLYGVNSGGGFVLLTGEIGAGKTTVCRCFLEQVPRRCNVAYIFNPKLTVGELLQAVCDEFGIAIPLKVNGTATVKDYVDPLNEFLLRTHAVGQNNVLVIDEAQNLSAGVLEQLRLLTNLETSERKLLQIILIGQPELRQMLARPELEQLAQRVIARYHLGALSGGETAKYIRHRLSVAGLGRPPPFTKEAVRRIHALSRGVPRRINLLCDRAMLGAYATGRSRIDSEVVDKAAREVFEGGQQAEARAPDDRRRRWIVGGAAAGALALAVYAGVAIERHNRGGGTAATPAAAASASTRPVTSTSAPPGAPASVASAPNAQAAASATAASAAGPAIGAGTDLVTLFPAPLRDERQAWRELAPAWKLMLPDGDPCVWAQRQRVWCHRQPGAGLALVRELGRPGFLTLRDAAGKPAYAQLTALSTDSATLRMGTVTQRVPIDWLERHWKGDFATFWLVPTGYTQPIAARAGGPVAQWLGDRLASLPAEAMPGVGRDAPLPARLQAFQSAHGLAADGWAGPTTFMQLNRALGIDEPRLAAER